MVDDGGGGVSAVGAHVASDQKRQPVMHRSYAAIFAANYGEAAAIVHRRIGSAMAGGGGAAP
jgi:hypothetical protein